MAQTVTVGCKLPHGIIIRVDKTEVTLNGANKSNVIGGHGLTSVDKAFWDAWVKDNSSFVPYARGMIFAKDNEREANAVARERKDEKTGFEGLDPAANGVVKAEKYEGMAQ